MHGVQNLWSVKCSKAQQRNIYSRLDMYSVCIKYILKCAELTGNFVQRFGLNVLQVLRDGFSDNSKYRS